MNKPIEHIFPNPPAGLDPAQLDAARVPRHVAVIMDGNGRWAKKRALNRLRGHKAGIEAVRETIRCASDVGVRYLTIYSFSTENWKRPQDEVVGLMDLFAKTMLAEVDGLHEEHVRVRTIGDLSMLPQETRDAFEEAWEKTRNNDGMTLIVAVNYGARQEILRAAQECARIAVAEALEGRGSFELCVQAGNTGGGKLSGTRTEGCAGKEAGTSGDESTRASAGLLGGGGARWGTGSFALSESLFESRLQTAGIPDPDLLIRTSGEMRLSNFLLWQAAYSEFYCTNVLWPDFDRYEFLRALLEYQGRERRFGAV